MTRALTLHAELVRLVMVAFDYAVPRVRGERELFESAVYARMADAVQAIEIGRDLVVDATRERDAVLERIERALGASCTGDLAADVARLVEERDVATREMEWLTKCGNERIAADLEKAVTP